MAQQNPSVTSQFQFYDQKLIYFDTLRLLLGHLEVVVLGYAGNSFGKGNG